jgi:hypothetical protein
MHGETTEIVCIKQTFHLNGVYLLFLFIQFLWSYNENSATDLKNFISAVSVLLSWCFIKI